jgi:hypothetical protein
MRPDKLKMTCYLQLLVMIEQQRYFLQMADCTK